MDTFEELDENWAYVTGYPDYMVSDQGRVLNISTGKMLRPIRHGQQARVTLSRKGQRYTVRIATLVAQAFIAGYTRGMTISHIDDDELNNAIDNISAMHPRVMENGYIRYNRQQEWGTPIVAIETNKFYSSVRRAAEDIGGDYSAIYKCLRGDRRSHRGLTFRYWTEEDGVQ